MRLAIIAIIVLLAAQRHSGAIRSRHDGRPTALFGPSECRICAP